MESKEALENWYNTESPATKAYEYELHYRIIKKDLDRLEKQDKVIEIFKKKCIYGGYDMLIIIESTSYETYCDVAKKLNYEEQFMLNEEEYTLFKEVFAFE